MTVNKNRKRETRDIAARAGLSYQAAHNLVIALGYETISRSLDDGKTVSEIREMARRQA